METRERARRRLGRAVAAPVALLAGAMAAACGLLGRGPAPLPTAPDVDLSRYLGTWYEIARLPTWFQRGCEATTATYLPADDAALRVVNRCRRDGEIDEVRGVARLAGDGDDPAKLEVQFFWPFWGDYWILATDEDAWSLVGTPDRRYLWILSREPELDPERTGALVARAAALGFDTGRLAWTSPPPADTSQRETRQERSAARRVASAGEGAPAGASPKRSRR